jgi:hypothetical protein
MIKVKVHRFFSAHYLSCCRRQHLRLIFTICEADSQWTVHSKVIKKWRKNKGIIPFQSIVKDVEIAWLTMLHQLLAQLRTDLQLPRCLQVVGYLRRMELFSEAELRLKFLQARDTWLQNLLSAIPKEDGMLKWYTIYLVL